MALPPFDPNNPTPISIGDIQTEFGGTGPRALSSYKRGGGLVPNHEQNANIPTTNSNIALSKFYGTARNFEAILIAGIGAGPSVGYIKDSIGSMNFTFVGKTADASSIEITQLCDLYSLFFVGDPQYTATIFQVPGDNRGTWWSSISVTSPSLGQRTFTRGDQGIYNQNLNVTTWGGQTPGSPDPGAFFGTETHNIVINIT